MIRSSALLMVGVFTLFCSLGLTSCVNGEEAGEAGTTTKRHFYSGR